MDLETLKERIENLDPAIHGSLRRALMAEYDRLTGRAAGVEVQRQTHVDPFEGLFRIAASDLGERYIRGTDDYIREHHPDLYRGTEDADKRMNETWAAGRQGKATIDEFREALRQWHLLHLEGIEIFAKHRASLSPGTEILTGE